MKEMIQMAQDTKEQPPDPRVVQILLKGILNSQLYVIISIIT